MLRKLFREDALRHHMRGADSGALVQLFPAWTRVASWTLLGAFATLAVGLGLVRIHDYATGPALIQVPSLEVVATAQGRTSRVVVKTGDTVGAGDVLVELYSEAERDQHRLLEKEFRRQLANALLDPLDTEIRKSVASARTQLDASSIALNQRSIRAPEDGIVTDVRMRTDEYVVVGASVMTLRVPTQDARVLALLPGRYRPMLAPGQRLRLELEGFQYEYQDLTIKSVSNTLLGPGEIRRYLGPALGDAVAVDGPVVIATAELAAEGFRSRGVTYAVYTGMPGTARVTVGARNGWLTLLPVLEYLRGTDDR